MNITFKNSAPYHASLYSGRKEEMFALIKDYDFDFLQSFICLNLSKEDYFKVKEKFPDLYSANIFYTGEEHNTDSYKNLNNENVSVVYLCEWLEMVDFVKNSYPVFYSLIKQHSLLGDLKIYPVDL